MQLSFAKWVEKKVDKGEITTENEKKKLNDQTPTYGDTEQIIIPCLFRQPDKYDNNSDDHDDDGDGDDNRNRAMDTKK